MAPESYRKNDPEPPVVDGDKRLPSTETNQQQFRAPECNSTYRAPPCVRLLGGSDASDCCDETSRNVLVGNLRIHGWSPIVVPDAPSPSPSKEEILGIFRRRNQRVGDGTNELGDVVYVPSESGSSEGTVEPKESLEVGLSNCQDPPDGHPLPGESDERTVKTFCRTLSWIAHRVCGVVLELPPDSFLPLDPGESLDLLRVFHYYAVAGEEGTSPAPTLGSSEHTDWGSLTVVWQDAVGGLQTYCRSSHRWIDVRPEAEAEAETPVRRKGHRWRCIVHVGDMASLVLGSPHAGPTAAGESNGSENDKKNDKNNDADALPVSWPSPRHRVVSPSREERVSLVYFGYPPRSLSLDRIRAVLDGGWKHSPTRGRRLPLGDYYLLRNQSATGAGGKAGDGNGDGNINGNEDDSEAGRLFRKMWDLPIQDIVRLKWEQVNRD
ncbi:unnamed protein product [Pseudo-nitzschia multistriata]|uniref:Fe2OG dioxygenase domain-containing protein n=1 Tax=Pseudo-nitzschia multistriata TaxID=183589 RepID=A0A448Z1T7_9STRA|nr:unnamed protein product [Pseudo-nitzschia multistriata]